MPAGVPAAHASALLALPATHASTLLAFWFAGDRESAPNVQIAMSALDRATGIWSPALMVVNRWEVAEQLGFGIRRLGNPVAWVDGQGRVHLFVVATGLGGWAAGRVVHLRQAAPTLQAPWAWEAVAVLPLSWLWNTSYLVRTAPLPLADGGLVLPAYFELARKYPVALRLDAQGALRASAPMSTQGQMLQPALLALDQREWLAFMRDSGPAGRIRVARTRDAGVRWSDAEDLPLDNPNASVATLTVGGQHLLVYNPQKSGRDRLRMASSLDGTLWGSMVELENGPPGSEYSYPAMAMVDGEVWVSYTDQRQSIAWQRFAWVSQAWAAPDKGRP
jgi:predicted neuraminidase